MRMQAFRSREGLATVYADMRKTMTTFKTHVSSVVEMVANPKMFRIYARWIIARMTNELTIRNLSFMQFIGKMSNGYFFTINSQSSISRTIGSYPNPAVGSLFNISPKSSYGISPTFTAETTEAGNRFTALLANKIARIFSHLKVLLSGVTPPAAITARGLFDNLIISQGVIYG